jgi:hypothetical protein
MTVEESRETQRLGGHHGRTTGRLLSQELNDIAQGCANIVGRDVVFPLNLAERHSASKASQDNRDREPGTANYGLTIMDGRVNDNSIQ